MDKEHKIDESGVTDNLKEGDVLIVEDSDEITVLGICGRVFILSQNNYPDIISSLVTSKNLEASLNLPTTPINRRFQILAGH